MATVDKAARADSESTYQGGNVRPWWQRAHTYFFVLLLLVNIFVDGFAFRPDDEPSSMFWIGILLTQTFLMGFWMALGGLNSILRGIAVVATTAGGALAFWRATAVSQGSAETLQELLPLAGTIVLTTYVLLLPLRLLMSWRVDFDRAYHASRPGGRMQLRLADCINVVTACALLSACARYLDRNLVSVAIVGGGITLLNSLPIALLTVIRRPSTKAWLFGTAALGVSLVVEYLTMVYLLESKPGLILPIECGRAAVLFANLLPLRCIFGLHLFSVVRDASELAIECAARELAEVEAAWPTLPKTVRAQIVTLARGAGASEATQPTEEAVASSGSV